jgi:hypothetical protein
MCNPKVRPNGLSIVQLLTTVFPACNEGLVSTIHDYISLRRAISKHGSNSSTTPVTKDVPLDGINGTEKDAATTPPPLDGGPTQSPEVEDKIAPIDPTPTYVFDPQYSSRDMLIKIGKLTGEILRASEEKINLSHTALESVRGIPNSNSFLH